MGRLTSSVRPFPTLSLSLKPCSAATSIFILPGSAYFTLSLAVGIRSTLNHRIHAARSFARPLRLILSHNRYPPMSVIQQPNNGASSQIQSSCGFAAAFVGYKNMSPTGLTPRSTRTQPARATATSLGTDCPSPLTARLPVGPVNFFR